MTVDETAQKIVQILTERAAEAFTGQVTVHINFRDGGVMESLVNSSQSLTSVKLGQVHVPDSVLRAVRGEGAGPV